MATEKVRQQQSLGVALRAIGYNHNICMIQFIKGEWDYGEFTVQINLNLILN